MKNEDQHEACRLDSRMDDEYGVTCGECGQVLEGYGYSGWLGSYLTGEERCVHAQWYVISGGRKACPYCREIMDDII